MRSNNLIWILVLGGVAYWLFFKKESSYNGDGNGDSGKAGSEFGVADSDKNAPNGSGSFAKAGNPDGAYTAQIPVAEASVSFL